jgi:hypothetical protein
MKIEMRVLVLIAMIMAGCSSSYRISPHRPTSRWALVDGPFSISQGFETLTPEQARGIHHGKVMTLYLPDLRTIDKRVAAALAETKATSLHLCGLEDLDVPSATELAKYSSAADHVLCLDGLVQARPEVLEALVKTKKGLSLNGLRELDGRGIKALGSSTLQHLELGGIRRFNAQAAAELRFLKAKFCFLHGLEELSLAAAQALSKSRIGSLTLTGLRNIDPQVAAVLASWERGGKDLMVSPSIRRIIDQANKKQP